MVNDDLFTAILNELRPGTALPDPTTLSRDVQSIYHQNMQAIQHYFRVDVGFLRTGMNNDTFHHVWQGLL
ncbi:hypothetical protein RSAG8_11047, partial [Rhizoctonia solani AG-8 WAC10335]